MDIYVMISKQMCFGGRGGRELFLGEGGFSPFLFLAKSNPMSKGHTLGWHVLIPTKQEN